MHQAGHLLDLIFDLGIIVDVVTAADRVLWSDHFIQEFWLNTYLDREWECTNGPGQFQDALWHLMPPSGSLDVLMEN